VIGGLLHNKFSLPNRPIVHTYIVYRSIALSRGSDSDIVLCFRIGVQRRLVQWPDDEEYIELTIYGVVCDV
jgi:hypothetical protein